MRCIQASIPTIFFLCQVYSQPNSESEKDTELVLVSIIFRHGARSTYKFYPTDPYINETFYPVGLGGLTNAGKLTEFQLGTFLREKYGDFLGEDYTEEKVSVQSTNTARTKMSAQLVMAGLFPPSKEQRWHEELMWQPIPVDYVPLNQLDIWDMKETSCPRKLKLMDDLESDKEVNERYIKPYLDVYQYITENAGMAVDTPFKMRDFHFILQSETEMNLTVPEWTKTVFPEPVSTIATLSYNYLNYYTELRKINAGYMIKKILDDSEAKIADLSRPQKMHLYSCHESTIGRFLVALNVLEISHIPAYGSAIFVEVHKDRTSDKFYFKLTYRNDSSVQPITLKIPGCDILCPIKQFIALQKKLLPSITIEEACKEN